MKENMTARERQLMETTIGEEVDWASQQYCHERAEGREEIGRRLELSPAKEARKALDDFRKSAAQLKAMGYEFKCGYHTSTEVDVLPDTNRHEEYVRYDGETKRVAGQMKALKRKFLLMLYSDAGVGDLLKELAEEISKVVGVPARGTCPFCPEPRLLAMLTP